MSSSADLWGLVYQKQVSMAGTSNYMPAETVGCNFMSLPLIHLNKVKRGYTGFTLSVHPSALMYICLWMESCLLCIFYHTFQIHVTLHILTTKFRKSLMLLFFNSKIWSFANFSYFRLLDPLCNLGDDLDLWPYPLPLPWIVYIFTKEGVS